MAPWEEVAAVEVRWAEDPWAPWEEAVEFLEDPQ